MKLKSFKFKLKLKSKPSLSRKISTFVILLVLIICIGFGAVSAIFSSRELRTNTENALILASTAGANRIETMMTTGLETLQEVANSDGVKSMNLVLQRGALQPNIQRLGYTDIIVIKKDGSATYMKSAEKKDLSDMDYFKTALNGDQTVSDVIVDKATKEAVLMYAVPIKSGHTILGVLVGKKDLGVLTKVVSDIKFGKKGYSYLVNDKGTIVAHYHTNYVMDQLTPITAAKSDPTLQPFANLLEKVLLNKAGVDTYSFEGKSLYASYQPVNNSNWFLISVATEAEVLSGLSLLINILIFASILFLSIGIVFAILFGKSISKPILDLSNDIVRLSNYDLTTNNTAANKYTKKTDEVGTIANAIVTMQKNLTGLIQNINQSSELLASSSEELTATSEQTAASATEVAKTIEEIARGASDQARETEAGVTSSNELGEYIGKTQSLLVDLTDALNSVNGLKQDGVEAVNELVVQTKKSAHATTAVNDIIVETNNSSNKIKNASEMIKNIARQTNLLALNAAIEAARAGDAGRGFAVVADEIRNLAEQSSNFTDEIETIVSELSDKSGQAVKTIKDTILIVEDQTKSVNKTHTKFAGISEAIEIMMQALNTLNTSSKEMSTKKDSIIGILENLAAISEENAAGTQEVSASVEEQTASIDEMANTSEDLAKLAQDLQTTISEFKF